MAGTRHSKNPTAKKPATRKATTRKKAAPKPASKKTTTRKKEVPTKKSKTSNKAKTSKESPTTRKPPTKNKAVAAASNSSMPSTSSTSSTRSTRSTASRKPPRSTARPTTFYDLVSRVAPAIGRLSLELRAMIRRLLPDADEGIYGGAKVALALYSIGGPARVACGIGPGDDHVLLYFHHLAPADAPALTFGGQGKHCIHLRLQPGAPLDRPAIEAALLLSAARLRAKE